METVPQGLGASKGALGDGGRDVAREAARQVVRERGRVSTCGFSSGGALALGIAAHNNVQEHPLPQPRHIVAVSPGEVPWNDAEKARMQALSKKDVAIDYAFMVTVEKFMRHGCKHVPDCPLGERRQEAHRGIGAIAFPPETREP